MGLSQNVVWGSPFFVNILFNTYWGEMVKTLAQVRILFGSGLSDVIKPVLRDSFTNLKE